jgi:hypothetical protein
VRFYFEWIKIYFTIEEEDQEESIYFFKDSGVEVLNCLVSLSGRKKNT